MLFAEIVGQASLVFFAIVAFIVLVAIIKTAVIVPQKTAFNLPETVLGPLKQKLMLAMLKLKVAKRQKTRCFQQWMKVFISQNYLVCIPA